MPENSQVLYNRPLPGAQLNYGHPLTRGLVGCWLLNENGGMRAMDIGPHQNHGLLTGFSDPLRRPFNGLSFDGSNDFINCGTPQSLDFEGKRNISVEVWFSSAMTDAGIIGDIVGSESWTWQGWGVRFLSSVPTLGLRLDDAGITFETTGGAELVNNAITQFVGTYDGSYRRAYSNGQLITNTADQGTIARFGTFQVPIGFLANLYFAGRIYLARVWNRALAEQEVKNVFLDPYGMILK